MINMASACGIEHVLDVMNVGIAVLDRAGRITFWNRWLERHSGLTAAEAVGSTLTDVFPAGNYPRLAKAVDMAIRRKMAAVISPALNPVPLPMYLSADDLAADLRMTVLIHVFPLPDSAPDGGCLVQMTDTTAAVRRERLLHRHVTDLAREREKLAELTSRLAAILENVYEAVLTIAENGDVASYNKAARKVFGYAAEEVLGRNVAMIMPVPDTEHGEQAIQPPLRGGLAPDLGRERRVLGLRKDGELFPMQLAVTEVRGSFGLEFVCVVSDLSDIEAAREREQKAQAELERHRNHLAELVKERTAELELTKAAAEAASRAKSAFLTNISHEMRTPLHQVSGLAQLIRREPLSQKQADRLDSLVQAGQRLLGIIETVLELTRLEKQGYQPSEQRLDLNRLVAETVADMSSLAEAKGLALLCRLDPVPDTLFGDEDALRKSLRSYLDNALRFTESGGISVRMSIDEADEHAVRVRLEVSDSGIGIPEADQSRLFSLFDQIDNRLSRHFSGVGAGLAATRRLVEGMGGRVGCVSHEGEGSTFWLAVSLKRQAKGST